jgi:polyhydroxyalkanoate synthase
VDLKKLTMPLLNIYGKFDHLVPPESCEVLTSKVGSKDTEDICLNTGHIGIYVSSKCQKEFVPKIAGWLADRDKRPAPKAKRAGRASNADTSRKPQTKTKAKKVSADNHHAKETADEHR